MLQHRLLTRRLLAVIFGLGCCMHIGCGSSVDAQRDPQAKAIVSEPPSTRRPDVPVKQIEKSSPVANATTTELGTSPPIAKIAPDVQIAPSITEPMAPLVAPKIASQNLIAGDHPAEMPGIQMSQAHVQACKVLIGDQFPNGNLPDVQGKVQSLDKFRSKYTLVVFWSITETSSLEQLQDLEQTILPAYQQLGLRIVAINPLDGATAAAKEALAKIKPSFPCLIDAEGKFFAQVGKHQLPRTYLLDGQGKVLWLDIEYSRETRRQLMQALRSIWKDT